MRPLSPSPEPGRNFDLHTTLALTRENRMEVACWGPYQADPDLWRRALWQKSRLEGWQVLYRALDFGSPDGSVSNCVHAVTFLARSPGQEAPLVKVAPANWGESGSYWVALALRPWYLDPCRTHDWLLPRLGLDPQGLVRHGLGRNPTASPPLTRAVQAALHPRLLPNRIECGR